MLKLKKLVVLSVLVCVLITACSLNARIPATQAAPATGLANTLPPEIAAQIRNKISQTLGVPADQIQLETVEHRDWPDACLGLPQQGETCAQVTTPGWFIAFSIDCKEYRYHIDETGTNIRQES
jgi:hypothetical protein